VVPDADGYDLDPTIAEIYDQVETHEHDLALLRRLIGPRRKLRILEPFCGTGRLLLPLVAEGHTLTGLDRAAAMLSRARAKLASLPPAARARVTLRQMDVLREPWPTDYDLVILGGNCLYELATPEEQAACIAQAVSSLRPGGHLFVDGDHMEGELAAGWRDETLSAAFPTGVCADGTRVSATRQTIWCDSANRLVRFRRQVRIQRPDGTVERHVYQEQKHPPSHDEVATWLWQQGVSILATYGAHDGRSYSSEAPRMIFWAQVPHQQGGPR
jgi:SAM-dependent methyltransferase